MAVCKNLGKVILVYLYLRLICWCVEHCSLLIEDFTYLVFHMIWLRNHSFRNNGFATEYSFHLMNVFE